MNLFKHFSREERKLLKVFLLCCFNKLFHHSYQDQYYSDFYFIYSTMEPYRMDNKIIQSLIRELVESGEYTLEGIARYTNIPLDVIMDAAHENNIHFSITSWARIVSLYIQVKPTVAKTLFEKLLALKEKEEFNLNLLLE